jgi:probable HAF family extracellular repeat protein
MSLKTSSLFFTIFACLLTSSFCVNAATTSSITDLGVLSGADFSDAYGISADGSTIVGSSGAGNLYLSTNTRAFKYSNGAMIDIGTLALGDHSIATAISSDGSTIVGLSNITSGGTTYHAFKYDGITMTDLGTLGGTSSFANATSSDGSIIVGDSQITGDSAFRAFKYANGTMTDLGTLGGTSSSAEGISANGSVIVGGSDTAGNTSYRAFKYANGTMTDLGTLGGSTSNAYAVSADGSVIVGVADTTGDTSYRAFKYEGTTMTDLGTLGGRYSTAYAVSADGSVIVGVADTAETAVYRAFKYANGTMTDLGTLGGDISYAYAVSADGTTIAGTSETSTDEVYHAFIYKSSMVDLNNTYTSLYYNGTQLNSLLNLKNSLLKSSLTQDCNKFGANNSCISVGYRHSNVNQHNAQENATNLKFAYRFSPNLRAGFVVDQAFSSNDPENFTSQNSQPLMGIFTNFSQNKDGSGLNLRLAAAYSSSEMSIRRNILENTEAGTGSTKLKSSGLLAEISYAKKVSKQLQIKPFASLRKTEIVRRGYTENSGADFPISYESVKQKFTTAILGARSSFDLTKSTKLFFGAALEQNLRSRVDGYSGNISQVGSFMLSSPNIRKTTGFVEGGLSYDLDDSQRISSNVIYATQALNQAKVAMVYLSYSIGF